MKWTAGHNRSDQSPRSRFHMAVASQRLSIHAILLSLTLCALFSACEGRFTPFDPSPHTDIDRDLPEIETEGVLRALLVYSSTSYFLYRGRAMGYEYELLQRFARERELALEIVVVQDSDELISRLNAGEGDVIAYGMTITPEREEWVSFTHHLYLTHQVLVQRKPQNWRRMRRSEWTAELIQSPEQLADDTVTVRRKSAYYQRLVQIQQRLSPTLVIDTVSGETSTEHLIDQVEDGVIRYTIADENIAKLYTDGKPNLDIATPLSVTQRVAWAVRENSPELVKALNEWIDEHRDSPEHRALYRKYFEQPDAFRSRARSPYFSLNEGRISAYDELIKRYAEPAGWDWRLVSSIVCEESGFSPTDSSWAGARGLMQLMPATAAELGVENPDDPESSIRGGTRYLKTLWGMWAEIPDSLNRYQFALASYNAGHAHVLDAQRLAEKYGADPLQWVGNVETYMAQLGYPEYYNDEVVRYGYIKGNICVRYVRNIMSRYAQYRNLIPR